MRPNEMQVGGTHYRSSYGHWDWVHRLGMNYLEGNATKYVVRHRNKNGEEDLKKAVHYLSKILELHGNGYSNNCWSVGECTPEEIKHETHLFCSQNQVPELESEILLLIAGWNIADDLKIAMRKIESLIKPSIIN